MNVHQMPLEVYNVKQQALSVSIMNILLFFVSFISIFKIYYEMNVIRGLILFKSYCFKIT